MNANQTTMLATIKTARALATFPKIGSSNAPDGVLVYGLLADVRRAAAALGYSFDRKSEKVTYLTTDAGFVSTLATDGVRASFTIPESIWAALILPSPSLSRLLAREPAFGGMDTTNRAAKIETLRLAAMAAYARADAADANNDPSEHVNALYAAAQDAYRLLAAARSEAA